MDLIMRVLDGLIFGSRCDMKRKLVIIEDQLGEVEISVTVKDTGDWEQADISFPTLYNICRRALLSFRSRDPKFKPRRMVMKKRSKLEE